MNPEYRFGWGKSLWEILASYKEWYDAGLSDKEISQKIRETYPTFSQPLIRRKHPEKPKPDSR